MPPANGKKCDPVDLPETLQHLVLRPAALVVPCKGRSLPRSNADQLGQRDGIRVQRHVPGERVRGCESVPRVPHAHLSVAQREAGRHGAPVHLYGRLQVTLRILPTSRRENGVEWPYARRWQVGCRDSNRRSLAHEPETATAALPSGIGQVTRLPELAVAALRRIYRAHVREPQPRGLSPTGGWRALAAAPAEARRRRLLTSALHRTRERGRTGTGLRSLLSQKETASRVQHPSQPRSACHMGWHAHLEVPRKTHNALPVQVQPPGGLGHGE